MAEPPGRQLRRAPLAQAPSRHDRRAADGAELSCDGQRQAADTPLGHAATFDHPCGPLQPELNLLQAVGCLQAARPLALPRLAEHPLIPRRARGMERVRLLNYSAGHGGLAALRSTTPQRQMA